MRIRSILIPIALVTVLAVPVPSRAEDGYGKRFLDKAGHGVSNLLLGWSEIPKNMINISSDTNFLSGITWGLVRGVVHGVGRTVVGAGELISSPIPTNEYVTPAFVWDRLSEDTRYFGVHLPGEWTHFGPLDDGGLR